MIYLSMLMALDDQQVFRQALEYAGERLGVEFFSFRYDAKEMPFLRQLVRSFQGHRMTFHGPMRSAELTSRIGSLAMGHTLEAYDRAFELAQLGGAHHMVAHTHECCISPDEKSDAMQRCEENLHFLQQRATPYGITLCIENVSLPEKGTPLFDQEEYIALIRRLTECLALIDVGHVHCTGWDLEALCQRLGERISGFHLHSNDGKSDSHAWLHEGTLDVEQTRKIIGMYSNQADIVLEYAHTKGKSAKDLLSDAALFDWASSR